MNPNLSAIEKQMANFDFNALNAQNKTAQANIAAATSVADVKTEICKIWTIIRPFVIFGEKLPYVGKFLTVLAELLDALCGTV